MADPHVQQRLAMFQKQYSGVDLSKPSFSAHEQSWHNLQLVIVNGERWMEIRDEVLSGLVDMIDRVAGKHGNCLSRVGLLPDPLYRCDLRLTITTNERKKKKTPPARCRCNSV
jgi:hypothetical protein